MLCSSVFTVFSCSFLDAWLACGLIFNSLPEMVECDKAAKHRILLTYIWLGFRGSLQLLVSASRGFMILFLPSFTYFSCLVVSSFISGYFSLLHVKVHKIDTSKINSEEYTCSQFYINWKNMYGEVQNLFLLQATWEYESLKTLGEKIILRSKKLWDYLKIRFSVVWGFFCWVLFVFWFCVCWFFFLRCAHFIASKSSAEPVDNLVEWQSQAPRLGRAIWGAAEEELLMILPWGYQNVSWKKKYVQYFKAARG